MSTSQSSEQQQTVTSAAPVPATRVGRMRAAIDKAVAVAPDFLRGEVDADHMAHTMVGAVCDYTEQERTISSDDVAHGAQAQELQNVLTELMTCGSGYLAGRCDAACVARTMTQMIHEFAKH